jgi:hypothetical protein
VNAATPQEQILDIVNSHWAELLRRCCGAPTMTDSAARS